VFCYDKLTSNMAWLGRQHGGETSAHALLREAGARLHETSIERIVEQGLHQFITRFIAGTIRLGEAIAADYRFIE